MDPLSATFTFGYLILTVIQTTQSTYKFLNAIKNVNPRVDRLYYKIVSEREITQAWAAQMRAAVGDNLSQAVPPDKYKEVLDLLEKLERYMIMAQEKYRRVNPANKRNRSEMSKLRAKASFILSGYVELEDLVGTIKVMNDALRAIAPPPPPYAQALSVTFNRAWQEARESRINDQQTHSTRVMEERIQPEDTAHIVPVPDVIPATPTLPKRSSEDGAASPAYQSQGTASLAATDLSVSEIYHLCLQALKIGGLPTTTVSNYVRNATSRLRLWGVGLFEPSVSLDLLLHCGRGGSRAVREMFMKCAVIILIHTETILKSYFAQDQSEDLGEILTNIATTLLAEELQPHFLLQLQIAVDEDHGANAPQDHAALSESGLLGHAKSVSRTVELLFQLLPSIEILRENHWMDQARAQKSNEVPGSSMSITVAPEEPTKRQEVFDADLKLIQDFIAQRDKQMRQYDPNITPYGPIFEKEAERLRDIKTTHSSATVEQVRAQVDTLLTSLAEDIRAQANSPLPLADVKPPKKYGQPLKSDTKYAAVAGERDLRYFMESLQGIRLE